MDALPFVLDLLWLIFWVVVFSVLAYWFAKPGAAVVSAFANQLRRGAGVKVGQFEFRGVARIDEAGDTVGIVNGVSRLPASQADVERRRAFYSEAKNIALVHVASEDADKPGYFDVAVFLAPHFRMEKAGSNLELLGKLNDVSEVSYFFGEKFGRSADSANGALYTVRNSDGGFRVIVSAFGPMLSVATIKFHDGSECRLSRYLDLPIAR